MTNKAYEPKAAPKLLQGVAVHLYASLTAQAARLAARAPNTGPSRSTSALRMTGLSLPLRLRRTEKPFEWARRRHYVSALGHISHTVICKNPVFRSRGNIDGVTLKWSLKQRSLETHEIAYA